jgi:4-amino-4-deoxy-L-arabinose transferase-like glycosyltransferase
MDDPLFIWAAQQIHAHPLDPYGFEVNWYGTPLPMWNVTENPPLASYYIAVAARILGWSEVSLHVAFLLPAIAVVLGTYRLARRLCGHPLLAAGLTLFTPVFAVSSTTVMCDVLMLAFWVWAVVFWIEGTEDGRFWLLAGSGLLIGLATLTKYFGISLIPLLAVYSAASKRRIIQPLVCLCVPLVMLGAWLAFAERLYRHNLLQQAAYFAGHGGDTGSITTGIIALVFAGGCLAPVNFFAPWLWLRGTGRTDWQRTRVLLTPWLWQTRSFLTVFGGAVLLAVGLVGAGNLIRADDRIEGQAHLCVELQVLFWAVGGLAVLLLAGAELWNGRRDPRSWLLSFWVFGTFVFTAVFNWTINGRSILPMAPAMAILLVRRLERGVESGASSMTRGLMLPFAASALLAFFVARSDFLVATAIRQNARKSHETFGRGKQKLWFEGHWGYQFYMAKLGDSALDMKHPAVHPGDYLAVPLNNSDTEHPDSPGIELTARGPRYLSDMNENVGASFYSSIFGPLPFAFGNVPPERVLVWPVKP